VTALPVRARNWTGATIKRVGERVGLEISRHRPRGRRRAELLLAHGIELVIDVGANRGEYAEELREHGYRGRIVSFEPSSAASAALRQRSADDQRWEVRELAAWDEDDVLELGLADNFSSPLPIEGRLATLFPEARPRGVERVRATRLDSAEIELPPSGGSLLKLDVQGCERRALAGAAGILDRVALIETELSVAPLYRDQPLLAEMVGVLDAEGYQLLALDPILRDRISGEYLQFDGLFVRRSRAPDRVPK
jgi:FkbM family methyltransferase